jgi:dTDP-4-amino-4,6-dideoxygalactose transaminase
MQAEGIGKIIGGVFGLEIEAPSVPQSPPFLVGNCVCLVNARSAIRLLIDRLHPTQVWMPSYLCGAMLQAIAPHRTMLRFYDVSYELTPGSSRWIDQINRGDIVLVIDYFGFAWDADAVAKARERGAWILEDASQALLSGHVGKRSDFVVFSPRKFLGVPDGGILVVRADVSLPDETLQTPPASWWLKALTVAIQRREFDRHGGDREWFRLFRDVEREFPTGNYAMSELSRLLLMQAFDYAAIAERRRENYLFLRGALAKWAVFKDIPEDVAPLGFPICHPQRDRLRQHLFDQRIYPSVHWPIAGIVPAEFRDSHRLAEEIMTLPCDQRYSVDDMARMTSLMTELL